MTSEPTTLRACLIGPGRAGGSLALAWHRAGVMRFEAVHARHPGHPVAERLGCPAVTAFSALPQADLWIVAVPDRAIAEVARQLAAHRPRPAAGVAMHLSGALSSDVMAPLRDVGVAVASGHPLRSFPVLDHNLAFEGTWCGVEGDDAALALIEDSFAALGGNCFRLDASAKTAYHGAAVLAGNALVGLADAAISSWRAAGLSEHTARAVFADLAGGVVQNVAKHGAPQALSGPLSRGDLETVSTQLAELDARDPGAAAVYRSLSRRVLTLVDNLDAETRKSLENLLR